MYSLVATETLIGKNCRVVTISGKKKYGCRHRFSKGTHGAFQEEAYNPIQSTVGRLQGSRNVGRLVSEAGIIRGELSEKMASTYIFSWLLQQSMICKKSNSSVAFKKNGLLWHMGIKICWAMNQTWYC